MNGVTEDRGLPDLLSEAIRAKLLEVHVSYPGKVVKYDSETQKVDVQPSRKKKYIDGEEVTLPVIKSVPVEWPSTENAHIHLPLKVGDTGKITYCDRSIDLWKSGEGGIILPQDPRHHDLSDAVFMPGLRPFSKAFPVVDPDAIEIKNGDMLISVKPTGKIQIKNATVELITKLVESLDEQINTLTRMTVNKTTTLLGPQTILPTDIVLVDVIKTTVTAIKTAMETLKV